MVSPRPFPACGAILLSALVLCQCETVRTVKSTRSTGYTFDEKDWGGQGGGAPRGDEAKVTQRGYSLAEDGTVIADKPDLYKDKRPRGLDGAFESKKARFKKMEAETKAFRTPEYLKRQEFAGVTAARESSRAAREGNSTASPDKAMGKLFAKKAKSSTELATYRTAADREAGEVFETRPASAATAVAEAPRATGTPRTKGYLENVSMSLDDVKKMLNPGAYARGSEISN